MENEAGSSKLVAPRSGNGPNPDRLSEEGVPSIQASRPLLRRLTLPTYPRSTVSKVALTYCRIGERPSHTWFVLKCLLGYPDVRNVDGSWTDWGNLVRTTIKKH